MRAKAREKALAKPEIFSHFAPFRPARESWADAFQPFNKSNFNGLIRASLPFESPNFLQLNDPPNINENQY